MRNHELIPGEFSLAHGGLIIADEFPEWSRDTRETLREPLERGLITLTRTTGSVELPARFTLVANGNLCPCGGWPPEILLNFKQKGGQNLKCSCTPQVRRNYLLRLSGPILDRIDLTLIMKDVHINGLRSNQCNPGYFAEKIINTRKSAIKKWGSMPGTISPYVLENILSANRHWLQQLESLNLPTLRAKHKVLRTALTISLWDKETEPQLGHFIEAALYRPDMLFSNGTL